MVDLYNEMTKESGKSIIKSAWAAAGIMEALKSGACGLQSLDPFQEIDPMLETPREENEPDLQAITRLTEEQLKISYTPKGEEEDESDEDSEWELRDDDEDIDFSRNAFDAFE